eukprot:4775458-Amphidinium_carterae.1
MHKRCRTDSLKLSSHNAVGADIKVEPIPFSMVLSGTKVSLWLNVFLMETPITPQRHKWIEFCLRLPIGAGGHGLWLGTN